jgi:hypothetical protein
MAPSWKFPSFTERISALNHHATPIAAAGSPIGVSASGQAAAAIEASSSFPARPSFGSMLSFFRLASIPAGSRPAVVGKINFRLSACRIRIGFHVMYRECRLPIADELFSRLNTGCALAVSKLCASFVRVVVQK